MTESAPAPPAPNGNAVQRPRFFAYGLTLALTVSALFFFSAALPGITCAWLLLFVGIIAWPVWRFRVERLTLSRRAVLAQIATKDGFLKRWFWKGTATQVLQAVVALASAAVLLAITQRLDGLHWIILLVDAFILAVALPMLQRRIRDQVQDSYQPVVARLWPALAGNTLVVSIAMVAVDYYIVGTRDTRGLELATVASGAFDAAFGQCACGAAGLLVGTFAAADAASWQLAMNFLPGVTDHAVNAAGWIGFLLLTGFGVLLFTHFMLGSAALLEMFTQESDPSDRYSPAFVFTLMLLAVPYLYVSGLSLNPSAAPKPVVVSPPVDPCAGVTFDAPATLGEADREVINARNEAAADVEKSVDAALASAFGAAEKGVDDYLDWYFSLGGDYSRLGAVFKDGVEVKLAQKLEHYVYSAPGVEATLAQASESIEAASAERMYAAAEAARVHLDRAVTQHRCSIPDFDPARMADLSRDKMRAALATASAGSVTATFLAKKPLGAAAAKLAGKSTVKAAAKAVSKLLGKKALSTGGAALGAGVACSPAGPVALACAAVAALATWFAVDYGVLKLDELVNREEMRRELMDSIAEERAALREQLVTAHVKMIDGYAQEISSRAKAVFVPARDGHDSAADEP